MGLRILCLVLITAVIAGVGAVSAEEAPVCIWLATDPHHLAPELTDYGPLFQRAMLSGDGKITEHSGELVDAFLGRAIAARADAVVVTGDLTFNGERASLEDIAARFQAAWDAGVPVLVLPGNHDISSPRARSIFGSQAAHTDNVTQTGFEALCARFGRDQAIARDSASFSYIYAVSDALWLVMLDANTDRAPIGTLPAGTIPWLEARLAEAAARGVTVLSFSHQNLLPVNRLYENDFTISNCREVLDLYSRYGVRYSFSGHSHIQHRTVSAAGLTEYVTGPLCVSPLHYAVITVDGADVGYAAATLDLYVEEARRRFVDPVRQSVDTMLRGLALTEAERAEMAGFAASLNQAYFAGDTDTIAALRDSPAWTLWREKGRGTALYPYLRSIFDEP